MKKYKYRRTTENLVFTVDLSYKVRSLGEASTEDNQEHYFKNNSMTYKTSDRSSEVLSFDINHPFIVGVNGVISLSDNILTYSIEGDIYRTNLISKETEVTQKFVNKEYTNINYFYDEDKIGVDGILKNIQEVVVERERISVMDKFSKLKNAKSTLDIEQIGNGFYKIIDQTIK